MWTLSWQYKEGGHHSNRVPGNAGRNRLPSGNVCVQIHVEDALPAEEREQIDRAFRVALPDGVGAEADQIRCFSVPVSIGFAAIEEYFRGLSACFGKVSWYYGSAYVDDGITPPNWWGFTMADIQCAGGAGR
ncbi:hypothetical protein [Burkholderia sp. F1]|uniref:hypothetical protein n=1 Tax=Burkholderia sp. F1 TaxID=3366817 RepID=UPI003D75DC0A